MWVSFGYGGLFNFSFGFGVDGLNLWLLLLTTFLTPSALLVAWHMGASLDLKGPHGLKTYSLIFLAMETIFNRSF